jgi:pimeloyl-ACP methyl ester carboxylesterase
LARDFTVYVVNRKRGLQPGESMSDIAGHLANAIEHDLGQPVFLEGTSTGGSVALQLAVDRPDLVRRLVVVSAAYRLGPRGRELQAEMARLIRAGEPRQAWASVVTVMLPGPLRGPARPLSRLAVGPMVPADPLTCWSPWTPRTPSMLKPTCRASRPPPWSSAGATTTFIPKSCSRAPPRASQDGRVHIFAGWGHVRASGSAATAHLTLGFMLAGIPIRPRH